MLFRLKLYLARRFRSSLITPFLDPKMNVFGSRNRFAHRINLKRVDFQDSVFGHSFRVGARPEMGVQFRIKSYPKMTSGFEFPYVI